MPSPPASRPLLALLVLAALVVPAVLLAPAPPLAPPAGQAGLYQAAARRSSVPRRQREARGRAYEAQERMAWEFNRLRDPRTGFIPDDMRARELAHAAALPVRSEVLGKNSLFAALWQARGPHNVGGRTRGLAVDLGYNGGSNRRILAGGVSGGIFVSEDDGATWKLTSALDEFASVTTIAQDPNARNVWYHGTGEFSNSVRGAFYLGQGVYKSTDNGQSWKRLPGLNPAGRLVAYDDPFDNIWTVAVHPQGSVVLVAHLNGISRSADGGQTWQNTLKPPQGAQVVFYTDVAVAADGKVYAAMSLNGGNHTAYGIYRSADRGQTWTKLDVPGLAPDPYRIVLAAAPSDAGTVYAAVQKNAEGSKAADHQLFRLRGGAWTDLSASLPDVTQPEGGQQPLTGNASFSSQGGYDLLVKVKPDNADVVWIGGTNLYRSTDAGQSFKLVGGYQSAYTYRQFANHHSDQHALVFFPGKPGVALSGNDGGLSKTADALQTPTAWTSLNNGYVTSQFYAMAMDPSGSSNLLVGGAQDNGTWLTEQTAANAPWSQMLSGDGGYAAVAPGGDRLYVSSQHASVERIRPVNGQLSYSTIQPATLPNPPFIAPLALDPNDARVMYLATGNAVSRNSNLDAIAEGNSQPTDQNWTQLTGSAVGSAQTHQVTALAVSKAPAGRLVFAATDFRNETRVVRVDNPAANGAGTPITPPFTGAPNVACIALNPQNADEMMVVVSNYGVPSLYHSANGGQTWAEVEGNLGGADGPSIRWAAIQPIGGQKFYLLATSTGVYSATALAGAGTVWTREGDGTIGTVVTDMVATRDDGTVVAATHGRGIYTATLSGAGGPQAVAATSQSRVDLGVKPGSRGTATFTLRNTGGAALTFTTQATCTSSGKEGGAPTLTSFLRGAHPLPPRAVGSRGGLARAGATPPPGTAPAGPPGTVLIADDGSATPDDFVGVPGQNFSWYNTFTVGGAGFKLDEIQWYMRTEGNLQSPVVVTLYDEQGAEMASGLFNVKAAPTGAWYNATFATPIAFAAGTSFSILVDAPFGIDYPAGVDKVGRVPGSSFYFDGDALQFQPLSGVPGLEKGAFLIRAGGSAETLPNTPPNLVIDVSKDPAAVGESITFDASRSTDPDGQIVGYAWTFGDGGTGSGAVVSHAYARPGQFTVTLTATDNGGAQKSLSGTVTITGGGPCALTAMPATGTVAAGGQQTITVAFDAAGVAEGTYGGQVAIGGNGGQLVLPVTVTVSTNVAAAPGEAPGGGRDFVAIYPNPFALSTGIVYRLREGGSVEVAVYDARGRRVRTLERGTRAPGTFTVRWDGRDDAGAEVAAGVYFVQLAGEGPAPLTRRIVRVP